MTHVDPLISYYERALRIREVCNKTGVSRTHLYRLIANNKFPAPIHISERISVWREAEVNSWLREKFLSKTEHATYPVQDTDQSV